MAHNGVRRGRGEELKNKLFQSPTFKTLVSIFTSVLGGIFSNTLVTEITTPAGINWGRFYDTFSFWALAVVCIITFVFHRHLLMHEKQVNEFKDDEYCIAYARSQLIPAQVSAARQAIGNGDDEKYKAAMKQIKDSLK